VIAQDQAECDQFDKANVDCEICLVANTEDRPMAAIANEYLERTSRAVFGLIHPDVSFNPGALWAFYHTAMGGNVCGVVGRNQKKEYVWCYDKPGPVSTLDDCAIFFRRDLGIRFDAAACDSFYAYVTDLCLQAHQRGIPVVVPLAQANHRGRRYFTEHDAHYDAWYSYILKLRQKWAGVEFETT
jgi:hypothetical protein